MERIRRSKKVLLTLPIVLGGALLVLVLGLRGAEPGEARKASRMPAAEGQPDAGRGEEESGSLPLTSRGHATETPKAPPSRRTASTGDPLLPGEAPRGPLAGLWLDLNRLLEQKESTLSQVHRESVIRLTLQFLDLKEPEASAFQAAVSEAVAQLELAQDDLHRALEFLPPDLVDEDREEMERAIVEVYDVRKRSAVTRVGDALGASERHSGFREHLEMWMGYLVPL